MAVPCGYRFKANAGDGRSFGPEVEINAKLSANWSKILGDYHLTGRISDTYVGQAYDQAYQFGIPLPSYSIVNARLMLGSDQWTATLFVDNLTNKIAELASNNTQFQFNIPQLVRISTNQPRTYGTEINYKF